MAVRDDFAAGEVLAAADLNDTFASKVDYATPTNAQSGTAYTFVAADAEKLTTASNGSAVTLTIPPQSSVTWSDNTVLRVVNYGAGAVTIDGGSGVTVTNTSSTVAQYGAAVAIRTGSDAWTVVPFGGGDIPAATVSSPAATGQYTDTGITYDYYTFTASGTLTVDTAGFADVLVVGGGGGGGEGGAAGGGAGGHLYATDVYLPNGTLTVTVGAGGAAGNDGDDSGSSGVSGAASRLGDFLFSPGGGGGAGISRDGSGNWVGQAGQAGGSGGGSSVYEVGSVAASGAGVTTLGNNGGIGSGTSLRGAGGGGGAGAAGSNASGTTGGNGGAGTANSITGSSVTRAGGGGGSGASVAGSGGTGGGGTGTINSAGTGGSGTANTGGGGGGAYRPTDAGGAGGSGVVIVRVKV